MTVPVLTAVTDALWEAEIVAAFERGELGVAVVRRCVDLADLLAAAATGTARAVLLSADLRRLDRDALVRLGAAGLAIVGLVPRDEENAERRLRQLGVATVIAADAAPDVVAVAVVRAVAARTEQRVEEGYADPRTALPDLPPLEPDEVDLPSEAALTGGRVVAVWGPTGAPGRTTVAVGLATETAALGVPTLLVDADVYGGVVGQVLGLLEEAPGLAAAARAANQGTLDVASLAALCRELPGGLRLLSGIARAERWPELRSSSLEVVLAMARRLASLTVVDCAFALEQDEELSYDTVAPRRNGATLTVLAEADTVIAVGSGDPIGLQRLVRGLAGLREAVPGLDPLVVINRVRPGVMPGKPEREIAAALVRHAGVTPSAMVPLDVAGLDAATAAGRSLREAAPSSPARLELARFAAGLAGQGGLPTRRRLLRRAAR